MSDSAAVAAPAVEFEGVVPILRVADLEASLAYYADVLGFERQWTSGNVASAKVVGKKLAEKAIAAGIETIVFDRNGYLYHGNIKAFAEGAREGGLKF